MVEMSQNQTRYAVLPLDQLRRLDTLETRNAAYGEHAVRLGEHVAREALSTAKVRADEITAIIGVSSTGHLMPTLETHLIHRLRLSATCRRVPLTQLGCAGGAASLGLAAALSDGDSNSKVLVVSVELPSLSFPTIEPSPSDIVASTQFGDGAAAAIVAHGSAGRGPTILASTSALFPGTVQDDGVRSTAAGLRLTRPRRLAETLRREVGDAVDQFLARHQLVRSDIGFWTIHPRNPELLTAAAASLDLPDGALTASRTVWQRAGNLISAAVFHVLQETSVSTPAEPGTLGMVIAYGAGFGCEVVLLQARGWLAGETTTWTESDVHAAAESACL
jgi:alkylresorcinol/alkylpyrone synthase